MTSGLSEGGSSEPPPKSHSEMTIIITEPEPQTLASDKSHVSTTNPSACQALEAKDLEEDDPLNPHGWSTRRKLLISFGVIMASFVPTFSNSVYVASVPGVQQTFDVSLTLALCGIALYSIGFAVGPALASSASELFGRKYVLKGSLLTSLVFTVIAGSASTFRTMIIARTLAGISGSASVTPLLGVCNDLFSDTQEKQRDLLVSLYAVAMVWATQLGPLVGEAIVNDHNWRWTFWLTAILLGLPVLWLLPVPETFRAEIVRKKAYKDGKKMERRGTIKMLLKLGLGRPFHMLLVEPLVFPCAFLVAVSQVILFVLYVAYPLALERIYSFSTYHVGLSFLSMFVGSILGLIIVKLCEVKIYEVSKRKAAALGKPANPEDRLYAAMIGGILQPISVFWFAWTARRGFHWIVPTLSIMSFGCSFTLIQLGVPIYKNAIYAAQFGASALAPDMMLRYALSSPFPLFTVQMIKAMTFEWAMSSFAFISLPLVLIPFVLHRHGLRMRQRTRYLSNLQLRRKQSETPCTSSRIVIGEK